MEWFAQPEPGSSRWRRSPTRKPSSPRCSTSPSGPVLAEVFLETDDAGFVKEAPTPDPSVACFAFTPTRRGYVLAPLDEIPSAGQTIYVPDVGERVVLRVGSPAPARRTTVRLRRGAGDATGRGDALGGWSRPVRGTARPATAPYTQPVGPLAQLVEQGTFNPKVAGSNPARPTRKSLESGILQRRASARNAAARTRGTYGFV